MVTAWLLPLDLLPSFSCMFQILLLHVVHFTISTSLFTGLPGDGSQLLYLRIMVHVIESSVWESIWAHPFFLIQHPLQYSVSVSSKALWLKVILLDTTQHYNTGVCRSIPTWLTDCHWLLLIVITGHCTGMANWELMACKDEGKVTLTWDRMMWEMSIGFPSCSPPKCNPQGHNQFWFVHQSWFWFWILQELSFWHHQDEHGIPKTKGWAIL